MVASRLFRFSSAFFLLVVFAGAAAAAPFDFSGWDDLLKKYVKPGMKDGVSLNLVDYRGIGRDPEYKKLISDLASYTPTFSSTREKIAFWTDVYNIFAVKMIVDNPGVNSIKDAGSLLRSVWKKDAGAVGGKTYTLNEIEHGILRKLGDPRIHAAIVCASVSCPDLRIEAFDPARLDEQLDDQMKRFLSNRGKGLDIDMRNREIRLSSIFKWFEDDFEKKGGVRAFVARYLRPSLAAFVKNPNNSIVYMDYNWSLNGR